MKPAVQPVPDEKLLELGRKALKIEADAVNALVPRLDATFAKACRLCLDCEGRVVVTGMGKSGHIGNKIASTLASTGTPAFFMHPGEASHGDLGMITGDDIVILLSNSGESREIVSILPALKRRGVKIIAITGKAGSTLASEADVHLDAGVAKEACPLDLAPTASTTAALALGDALAVALLDARGFKPEDFAIHHPGGVLGRKLLMHVEDVMRKGDEIPKVTADVSLADGLMEMSRKGLGMTAVVDAGGTVLGVYTDGDLRRTLDKRIDVHATPMRDVMTKGGKTIRPKELAAEAVHLMETHKITALLVVDENKRLIGALNVHDLLRAGVV